MAIPFLYTLPVSARAAYPFILRGTKQGLSSRAIESAIRSAGLPISRARTVVPLMREINSIITHSRNLKFVPLGNVINTSRLSESLTFQRNQFSYKVLVKGIDSNGLERSQYIQIGTDRDNMTRGAIEGKARRLVEGSEDYNTVSVDSAIIEEGLQRGNSFFIE